MEEIKEFKVEVDTIDDWLDGFEARLEALDIRADNRKVKWCKAVIGTVGRGILKNTDPNRTWDQIKDELKRYLGEEDSRTAAWRNLKYYKGENKTLGEMAADILGYARQAATEEDVRQRLATEAFIDAIPWRVAKELKKKKLTSLKKALEEAKFVTALYEEEEKKEKKYEIKLGRDLDGPQEPLNWREIDNQQARRAIRGGWRATDAQQARRATQDDARPARRADEGGEARRAGRWAQSPRMVICWACQEKGHIARYCPLWQEWREQLKKVEPPLQQRVTREREGEADPIQLNW